MVLIEATCFQLLEKVIVVWEGKGIHLVYWRRIVISVIRIHEIDVVTGINTLQIRECLLLQDPLDEFREDKIAFPRDHNVYEGKLPYHLSPHDTFAVSSSSKDDKCLWSLCFDAFGQGQGGYLLLKDTGKTHDRGAIAEYALKTSIQKALRLAAYI
jgi:hypothetical protein